jgi:hypothetical protein
MNVTNVLTLLKGYLKNSLLLIFVSLALSLSSSSLLKAQDATPAVEPPAPQTAPAQASGPLATTESEQNPDVRLEVRELKRTSGGTVTLKFTIFNDSSENFRISDQLGGITYGYNVSGVHLVDAAGKKKYQVVVDSEEKCLCSNDLSSQMEPNSRLSLWAKFPAPPEGVKNITVVVPHFIPMEDVPVS